MVKRFLIADDSDVMRRFLRDLVASRPDWLVCGEAADGLEAIEMAAATQPDVAILDLQMPRMNGLDAARQIASASKSIAVLLVSSHDPDLVIPEIKTAQIRGFVSKVALATELFSAIEAVLAGGTWSSARSGRTPNERQNLAGPKPRTD